MDFIYRRFKQDSDTNFSESNKNNIIKNESQ